MNDQRYNSFQINILEAKLMGCNECPFVRSQGVINNAPTKG